MGAEVLLEVPLALSGKLAGRLWKVEIDRKRDVARLRLPTHPCLPFCDLRLAAGARHPARFIIRGGQGLERGGNGIAIRQLFEGEEVGRVTWQFHRRHRDEDRDGRRR